MKLIIMRNVAEIGYEEGQVRETYQPTKKKKKLARVLVELFT